MYQPDTPSRLLELPAELVHIILTHLNPIQLTQAGSTCRALHALTADDRLWHALVNEELLHPLDTPASSTSFQELYVSHHPYWFLPRNKIWFSDSEPNGKLLLARYDEERGGIVAHTITAMRGQHTLEFWEKDREVIIHSFNPIVSLDLNQPVLRLDADSISLETRDLPSDRGYAAPTRYNREVPMPLYSDSGLFGSFMLCRTLPDAAIGPQTQLWPPLRFPSDTRTRNDSLDNFNSLGHRPTSLSDVSQHSFRLHKWVQYSHGRASMNPMSTLASSLSTLGGLAGGLGASMTGPFISSTRLNRRFPESITTYATLPPSCYTPTEEKPWQGIWCGDYSGHGCEFLVITQPDRADEKPLPEGMNWLREWFRGGRRTSTSSNGSYTSAFEEIETPTVLSGSSDAVLEDNYSLVSDSQQLAEDTTTDYGDAPSGRIEAIKLTGDPNIPRGQYTFIAPDIGHRGFVRVADEETFRGARVVRSAGHIAGRGFREAQYTPSQLIMVSHDRLAQFWEGFGHISFYQRVDLEALMRVGSKDDET